MVVDSLIKSLNFNDLPVDALSGYFKGSLFAIPVLDNSVYADAGLVAENGTTATYNITVTRQDSRSDNNNLKSLTFNGNSIALTNLQSNAYTLTVNHEVTNAEIKAISDDANAKIEITDVRSLKVGSNIFTIKVTAENNMLVYVNR